MEEVKQNVVSIGIGVIPKMDLVTTTTKKNLSKPYELHWLMANNAVIISQEHHTSFYMECMFLIILLDGHGHITVEDVDSYALKSNLYDIL